MVTIKDIADEANVSPATVSLVLNSKGRVSDRTRREVLAVSDRLGYRRRAPGRPLERTATWNVAVVYARRTINDGALTVLAQTWINSIRQSLAEAGSHLSVFAGLDRIEDDVVFSHALDEGELDGIILVGATANDPYLRRLSMTATPLVVMNRRPHHGEFSAVLMDNFAGGRQAAEHLLELGHRRLGILEPGLEHDFSVDRCAGFEAALATRGLQPVAREIVPEYSPSEAVVDACRRLVATGATAIFTGSDRRVVECTDALAAHGPQVPDELSLIGFDNMDIRSAAGLRPTSLAFDARTMGTAAARVILDLLADRRHIRNMSLVVPTRLVQHDTTAPPPTHQKKGA